MPASRFRAARPLASALLILTVCAAAGALPARAQDLTELPTVTRTFAIVNARIVQAPGQIIEQGTVVMRDGLITAVGDNVEIPYDARRIGGDSLVVYAGFIDGLSHAGVETPKLPEEICDDVKRPGDLRFGFMTLDAKPEDVRENLRTMIEHGLPEEAALAALTTDAAALMGLSERLGTVEEGKIANLVVTSRPCFEEESNICYVFVDGRPFEYEAEDIPSEGSADPVGTWRYTVSAPQGEITGMLTIEGNPGALTGTISSEMTGTLPLDNVQLNDNALTFSIETEKVGRVSATLTFADDAFEGTLDVAAVGEVPITGERTSDPSGQ